MMLLAGHLRGNRTVRVRTEEVLRVALWIGAVLWLCGCQTRSGSETAAVQRAVARAAASAEGAQADSKQIKALAKGILGDSKTQLGIARQNRTDAQAIDWTGTKLLEYFQRRNRRVLP